MELLSFSVLLFLAFGLDLVMGDPASLPHPVRWIGRAIGYVEGVLRGGGRDASGTELRALGIVLALVITLGVYVISLLVLGTARHIWDGLYYLLYIYMVWASLSIRSLGAEAAFVLRALGRGDIEAARTRLSGIVGRDTAELSEEEVYRAASETVAENTSDGVVAPLFYLALGGPALMLAYKAVNTLDSMVGYRNERYRDFGWFPARLDDFANFIPARLTAFFMVGAAFILGYDWQGASRIIERDKGNHPSPNAGLPEAAVAGAMGVRFGGTASYNGVVERRPFIGDGTAEHGPSTLKGAVRILYAVAFISIPGSILLYFFLSRLLY